MGTPRPLSNRSETLAIDGNTLYKHPIHYYDDGNLIFIVEDEVYRVHRSILTRRSSVMKDMITVGNPSGKETPSGIPPQRHQTSFDGVPVVVLNDGIDDFALMLDFIYPPQISLSINPLLPLTKCMDMIRLADKYEVSDLRNWAVAQLEAKLPTSADTLQLLSTYNDPVVGAQVIALCNQTLIPQFLPLAFYTLATTEWTMEPSICSAVLTSLSPEDQHRIMAGRVALQQYTMDCLYKMPASGFQGIIRSCCSGTLLSSDPERWKELLLHPLEEVESRLSSNQFDTFCEGRCRGIMVRNLKTFRSTLIGRLPRIFGLDQRGSTPSSFVVA